MNRARWQRIESVFQAALERTGGARAAFLEEACEGDRALRAEVDALLREHDSDPHFLERPLVNLAVATPAGAFSPLTPDSDAPLAIQRVGPYRLVREVGSGGMGVVYLAMHEGPGFERPVALKVMRRGTDTGQMLRRFQLERRLLAALRHPNVARLLDAGAMPDGRPYFVMDFVEGTPIDAYCDRHALAVRDRLRLFLHVVSAVEHAHASLIVHRDIKPGNILVTEAGAPMLLDFGIGKLLDHSLASDPAVSTETMTTGRAFTPAYASPEQIRGEPVSTATDVYGLGALLYQLLTGKRPFEGAGIALERAVLDTEPPRPSSVTDQPVDGDLDAIVLKAMRKEQDRRYTSVAALADDVQRFLEGQPVRAHAGSFAYRAGKFARRNRVAIAAGTIVFGALAAATWYSTAQARAVARERDKALAVQGFLLETFGAAGTQRGDSVSIRQLLDGQVATLPVAYAGQPELRADMLGVLAEAYDRLGLFAPAESLATEALALRRATLRPDHPDIAFTVSLLGWIQHERGRSKDGEARLREALALWPSARPRNPSGYARTLNDLGVVLDHLQSPEEAATLYEQALAIRKDVAPNSRAVAVTGSNLAVNLYRRGEKTRGIAVAESALAAMRLASGPDHQRSLLIQHNLGSFRAGNGDWIGAEADYRDILARQTRVLGRQHPVTSNTIYALGSVLRSQGKFAAADTVMAEALGNFERSLGPTHVRTSQALVLLGGIRHSLGRTPEAIVLLERGYDIQRAVRGPTHRDVVALRARIDSLRRR
jgi:tetratricopeptide (TPR) repeat protein